MSYARLDGCDTPKSSIPEGYARLIAQGWDTVQEAMALKPLPKFVDTLNEKQEKARQIGESLEGTVPLDLGDEQFQVAATGAKGGFRWRIENDDMLIFIGSPARDWTISVRYLSAGLWEHGLGALRDRAARALDGVTKRFDNDWIRTSRCDWCFDFYSPTFATEFRSSIAENVVCHAKVKKNEHHKPQWSEADIQAILESRNPLDVWSCGTKGETLTIGKKNGVQLQLYNKAKEITRISGKTWMYDVWASGLDGEWVWSDDRVTDVFRLEVRYGSDFLKNRNVRRPQEVGRLLPQLINEALHNRRLTVPNGDANRRRWPLHPLWVMASEQFDCKQILPIGRQVTGKRDQLSQRALAQLAGAARSSAVLKHGAYRSDQAKQLLDAAFEHLERDPEHGKKEAAAQSRYATVDEAS